jgi:hypothetical protein
MLVSFYSKKKIKISFSNATTKAKDPPFNYYPNYKTNIVKKIQIFHLNKHDFISSYIKRIHSPLFQDLFYNKM